VKPWSNDDRHRLAHELVRLLSTTTPGPPEAIVALLDAALICAAATNEGVKLSVRERVVVIKQGLDLLVGKAN
jgi:hypothetical protein